jgi:hypothetical protein
LLVAPTNQNLPITLLALVNGALTPVFLPFRWDRAISAAEHPGIDGKMFAYKGGLIGMHGYLVKLMHELFNLTGCMRVPTIGHVHGLLAADLQATTVGPFDVGAERLSA